MKKILTLSILFLFSLIGNSQTIYLDAGHGYTSTGGNPDGRTSTEINTNLAVAIRVQNLLNNSCGNVNVIMSRTESGSKKWWTSVSTRALEAQNYGADRLLSFHCNADGDATNDANATSTARGTETYYGTDPELTANTASATVHKNYATKVQAEVAGRASQYSRNGGVPFNRNNLGIFGRSTTACLNEMGFVDNAAEKEKLLSATGRDNFALGFFNALKSNLAMTCSGTVVAPGTFTLTATPECNGTTTQVKLIWTTSVGATAYDVYRNGSLWFSNAASPYINTTNVAAGTTYTYTVKAKNASTTQTSNSNGVQSVVAKNCSTPTPGTFTLTATPLCIDGTSQNKLTWTASANATAYDIYRNNVLYYENVTGTTWTNSYAITAGTTYTYSVKAKNSTSTQTTNSNGTQTIKAVACVPGAFNITVTPDCSGTASRMNITWTTSANATAYDIYRNGNATPYAQDITGNQFLNTWGITAGSTYTFRVVAKNNLGTTNNSNGTISKVAINCASGIANNDFTPISKNDELVANKIFISNEINIYPNPTNGEFFLKIDNTLDRIVAIDVFNLTGQNVYSKTSNSVEEAINENINIKELPTGIYIVKIAVDGKEYNKKIVKQ